MDITLESSVESFCAVGVSLDESDEFQQLVGVTLDWILPWISMILMRPRTNFSRVVTTFQLQS